MLEEWQPSSHSNGSAGSAEDRKAIRGDEQAPLAKDVPLDSYAADR